VKTALTIAGFDPTGGAGVQQDSKVFHHFGVYALSVVAALTSQNTYEIKDIMSIEKRFLEGQLYAILSDIRPDALKTGMLFSKDAVRVVVKVMKGFELQNLVIDPVTVSSTGTSLTEDGTLDLIMSELLPLSKVVTPNIYEASVLSGIRIQDMEDLHKAAELIIKHGSETVIITGFNLIRDVKGDEEILDLLYDGIQFQYFRGKRIYGEYHGTGCAFSSAITALLARGATVPEAMEKSKEFMNFAIENALKFGRGLSLLYY
jgi:hydroxymethylpyrimidine/phosphomethylpyrimidine kinase